MLCAKTEKDKRKCCLCKDGVFEESSSCVLFQTTTHNTTHYYTAITTTANVTTMHE